MKKQMRISVLLFVFLWGVCSSLAAQTTGKIAGIISDKETGEPLPAVNVFIEGTSLGAATDLEGRFVIINLPPGKYTLNIHMMGYARYRITDLRVSVNRTANISAELSPVVLAGETVVVQAQKIATKKDQTSSIRNVSFEQIDLLPVEDVLSVVNLQAGVVNGHFRGGRSNEVSFMIDGIQVVEGFAGENNSVNIETDVVQELEVITGTFNAEYGRAMSGIVNAVTKNGGNQFHGFFSANSANYFTSNKDIFPGLKNSELDRRKDLKFQLSGPLLKEKLNFLVNFRQQNNKGYLNGIARFKVDDHSGFIQNSLDPNAFYSFHSGTGGYVNFDDNNLRSISAKLSSTPFKNIRTSFLYTRNDEDWGDYNHIFKYNPDGKARNYKESNLYNFQLNHMLSQRMFYDLKLSYLDNFYGWYVYEDPQDSRYVHDAFLTNAISGFYTGGQEKGHESRTISDYNGKFDITWQANKRHLLKTGLLYTKHTVDQQWHSIQNAYEAYQADADSVVFDWDAGRVSYPNYEAVVYSDSSIHTDAYKVEPYEFSAYIQDKMEFNQMVVNLGVRYDYFNPNTVYPSQLRNPANQTNEYLTGSDGQYIRDEQGNLIFDAERMSVYPEAKAQTQLSPRLGLSYTLGSAAVLHFSYGHFFQMPPMYALYENHSFLISPNDYETTMGNARLKTQKTVQYEVGLWQELAKGMGLEVIVFYRDIYNLLSTKVISTFNQKEYGLYTNKDYGNAKGLELKYDLSLGNFSTYLNYTLQYTRGNADNPTQTFNRLGESKDPIPKLIPMSWDQRHTLNVTASYNSKRYGITATGYINSGSPYTWTPFDINRVANVNLYANNSYQGAGYSVDLNGFINLYQYKNAALRLNFSVYNLFDRLNENWVDSTTGRAYTSIIEPSDISSHFSDFNAYQDTVQDPSMYAAPRLIKMGLDVSF